MVTAPRTADHSSRSGRVASALLPMLAAAYPVVFLFASNAAEHVSLEPLWGPLLAAVAGAAAVTLVLTVLLRDGQRASLLTTVLVASFFGYGHAWNAVASVLDSQWPFIIAWLLVTVMALAAAWRAGAWTSSWVRGLAIVAGIALLLNTVSLTQAVAALATPDPLEEASVDEPALAPPAGQPLPDVWYLVPDRYASADTLARFFDYDNEPFMAELEERGFAVARGAHANYTKTPLSLGSSLNLDFLDAESLAEQANDGADRGPAHRLLRDPQAVPRALKRIGYRYMHVAGWWAPSSTNVDADRVFAYDGRDEFTSVLGNTTLLRAISDPHTAPTDPLDWRVVRASTRYVLDTLEELAEEDGPKYVFAHLLLPHAPYVFDADGSFMDRAEVQAHGERESYRRQLTYTNQRLLRLIDRILAESPGAIILLAADEGPFPPRYHRNELTFDWRTATQEELDEKFGTLLAMRVPDADLAVAGFHDDITPVNAFRVIFNARFGTKLPILRDRIWTHVGVTHFYDFVEITDRFE